MKGTIRIVVGLLFIGLCVRHAPASGDISWQDTLILVASIYVLISGVRECFDDIMRG